MEDNVLELDLALVTEEKQNTYEQIINLTDLSEEEAITDTKYIKHIFPQYVKELDIKANEFQFILTLWCFKEDYNDWIFVEKNVFAKCIVVSNRALSETIKSLKKKGYLNLEKHKGTYNTYSLKPLLKELSLKNDSIMIYSTKSLIELMGLKTKNF